MAVIYQVTFHRKSDREDYCMCPLSPPLCKSAGLLCGPSISGFIMFPEPIKQNRNSI
ncbi:hypothetical protein QTP88_023469 [Uroleucon formosanum]